MPGSDHTHPYHQTEANQQPTEKTAAETRATLPNGEDNWTTAMEVAEEEPANHDFNEGPQQIEADGNDEEEMEDGAGDDDLAGANVEVQNEVI